MSRISLPSLPLLLLLACDSASDESTKATAPPAKVGAEALEAKTPAEPVPEVPEAKPDPEAEAVEAKTPAEPAPEPPKPAAPTFTEQLAKLGADKATAIPEAIELFLTRYSAPSVPVDETKRFASLTLLLEFISQAVHDPYAKGGLLASSGWIEAAACKRSGQCEMGEATPEAMVALEVLEKTGIKVVYAGEGTFDVVPNHGALADRLAPALSPAARDYLLALMWETEEVEALYDEGGYAGDPEHVVEAMTRWEALADGPEPVYASDAEAHAATMAERYLRLCERPVEAPSCVVTSKHLASYRRFIKEHAGSRHHPCVEHFVTRVGATGSRLDEAQLDALVGESMAKARARSTGAGASGP